MAKTVEQLIQEELGGMHFQMIMQTVEILKLREENDALKKPVGPSKPEEK